MKSDVKQLLSDRFMETGLPEADEIYHAINPAMITENNLKFQKMYDWMSRGYDLAETVIGKIRYGNKIDLLRESLMSKLEWANNISVLYVSIGTGTDLKFIPKNIDTKSLQIVGVDISTGMLNQCKKRFKNDLNISLFHSCAEDLPFRDNAFDIVFHNGGINFFNDKQLAINEMLRVAKPGTKILIADETNDFIDSQFKKSKLSKRFFENQKFDLSEIEQNIPKNALKSETEFMFKNKFYCITFRKPNQ